MEKKKKKKSFCPIWAKLGGKETIERHDFVLTKINVLIRIVKE